MSGVPEAATGFPSRISLSMDLWTRIVFAAKDSPDARLAQMIEQAVASAEVSMARSAASARAAA